MGGRKSCCCCQVTPSMIETITFEGVDKSPSQWNAISISNCCPYVEWTFLEPDAYSSGVLLYAENVSETACFTTEFCVAAYVTSIQFYFAKFSCNADWWVAIKVVVEIRHGRVFGGACLTPQYGQVTFWREKFVPSIAPGTTITFSATDHYDWTAGGACHEIGSCPDSYTGEVSTISEYCCGTILDPNCGPGSTNYVNPVSINFLANDFSFIIS
jgi:hypothetical protein